MTVPIFFTTHAFSETKLLGTEKYWKAYSTKIDKTKYSKMQNHKAKFTKIQQVKQEKYHPQTKQKNNQTKC